MCFFTTNLGMLNQHQYWGHETHHVHWPSRTIHSSFKSGKQVHPGAVQNRWKPKTCQTHEKQNIWKMCKAYKKLVQRMNQSGIKIKKHILDNEASDEFLTTKWWHGIEYQKVPPNMHWRNAAEKVISTFKDHFKAILTGVDKVFPMHLWDRLLPQAEHTSNMLPPTNIAPKISAYAYMYSQYNFNKMPLAPMGCAILIHSKPQTKQTWDNHVIDEYYIKTSRKHYQCYKVWSKMQEA